MSTRPRRLLLLAPLVLAITACGPSGAASPSAPPARAEPSDSGAPAASASTDASAEPSGSAPETGQTDTDWGRIWDAVPAGFPLFPGATPADDASGQPASARYAVQGGDPGAIATWMQDALETATFSTIGMNGPAEDGSWVIDSVGEGQCQVQTTIAPLGDMTFITVLYGADCPAG
jgi:hypothetical protein